MHVLHLTEHLLGFYDGRTVGAAGEPIASWVDDGAPHHRLELVHLDIHSRDATVIIADQLAAGSLTWFDGYQRVHVGNLAAVASRT
jgi:hypothetical protein